MSRNTELKRKQQEEVNNFPMFFAFNKEQLTEGLKKFNVAENEMNKLVSIGAGGFILKSDVKAFNDMFRRHKAELKTARQIDKDKDGTGFIYDMFLSELNNHEYGYTHDETDAIEALGFTFKEINSDKKLLAGLNKAKQDILEWVATNS